MEFNSKVTILFVFFLLILFSGCTQNNPSPSQTTSQNIQPVIERSVPIPVSAPTIISKPGLYQLTNDLIPSKLNKTSPQELPCINIRSSDVIFDGMGHVIDGNKIKLKCEWSNSYNAKICEFSYGIYSSNSIDQPNQFSNIIIRNVTVSNWSEGFRIGGIKNVFLDNSISSNNDCGLRLFLTSNMTLRKNVISNNKGSGIEGIDNENLTISENSIMNNRNTGLVLSSVTNSYVQIPVPAQIQFILGEQLILAPFSTKAKRITSGGGHVIRQNTFSDNKGEGILLKDSEENIVEQNRILDNRGTGIWLDKVGNTRVDGNTIGNSGSRAIYLYNCGSNLILINNTLYGNYQNVERGGGKESVPFSLIFGTILVFLLKVLGGASNIYRKIQEGRIYQWIKRKTRPFEKSIQSKTQGSRILRFSENPVFITLVGAIIFGGAFAFVRSVISADVFFNLVFISGIVTVTPRAIQFLIARKNGIPLEYRIWWGGILIILITMFIPRIIFGQPVRTDLEQEERYDKKILALTKLAGPCICILMSIIFFLIYLMKGPFTAVGIDGLQMSLLSSFVMLLPISPMEGERVFNWNKPVWALLFFSVLIGYAYFLIAL